MCGLGPFAGMFAVSSLLYRAEDLRLHREVALKLLPDI